ncbi:MAG: glycosyltransferase [Arenicella sp.]|nr:glycosyltransferase [Arenicella sp.]
MRTISVLVAAFKAERWLEDSIFSIKNQQLPDGWQLQLLIGVDACQSTLGKAKSFADDRCRVISMAENCGTYVTFNTLMNYADGQLICRFDADDVMFSGYLQNHIRCIELGADMAMSWSIYTDSDLRPTSHVMAHSHYHPKEGLNRRSSEGQFVIKKSVWDRLGGFQPWVCAADTDFRERVMSSEGEIQVLEEFLYYRRTHPDSLTAATKTNFQSTLRKQIDARAACLASAYRERRRSVKILAVTGAVNAIY